MNSLTYRGPELAKLHEEYAKKGRIDDEAPIQGRRTITIEAPAERVWKTLTDVHAWDVNLEPGVKEVDAPDGVKTDAEFKRSIRRAHITAQFAVVDENRELTWTGSAFGANVVHRFVLEAVDDMSTKVVVEESMAGRFLGALMSTEKLVASLETSLRMLKDASERTSA